VTVSRKGPGQKIGLRFPCQQAQQIVAGFQRLPKTIYYCPHTCGSPPPCGLGEMHSERFGQGVAEIFFSVASLGEKEGMTWCQGVRLHE